MVSKLIEPKDMDFNNIQVGNESHFEIKITEEKVDQFATISGDFNPIHMDAKYAMDTKFKKRICHGMLLGSFFSQLVGMNLPGKKCLYLSQSMNFVNPCFIGDQITVKGVVIKKSDSTGILDIKTSIFNQNDSLLVEGMAKVMFLKNH